ncbi:unnamed protein product [Blepharisma stoltei]|uniref:Uncharacterized protein n=1 Tax=Blepharisma stoltei TaxID=1481888 RepID=A0AAU9IUF3_9CILI|nr:unnamed protein product [Blepharisma stoltei]
MKEWSKGGKRELGLTALGGKEKRKKKCSTKLRVGEILGRKVTIENKSNNSGYLGVDNRERAEEQKIEVKEIRSINDVGKRTPQEAGLQYPQMKRLKRSINTDFWL